MNSRFLLALLVMVLAALPACSGGDADDNGANGSVPSGLQEQEPEEGQEQPQDQQGDSGTGVTGNRAPTVSGVTIDPDSVEVAMDSYVRLTVDANDPEGDSLEYKWAATGGRFDSIDGPRATWRAPELTGSFVVTATVTDGRGGTTTAQTTFTVTSNQAPVISQLTATPSSVAVGGHVSIVASAQDPDGDPLSYRYTADGGEVTGVGTNVTWVAPDVSAGEKTSYTITLTVDDGRGGTAVETVDVDIALGFGTRVFPTVASESGTVIEDEGDEPGFFRAGDTANDKTMRAFFSFDLSDVVDTDVTEATLRFTHQATVGDPFYMPTGIRGIHVFVVRYDEGSLPDLYIDTREELTETGLWESPTEFDVTKFVQRIGEGSAFTDRMQFMVRFQRESNNDGVADYMEWSQAVLTVTFAPD